MLQLRRHLPDQEPPYFHPLERSAVRLGDLLLSDGAISMRQRRAALTQKYQSHAPLGRIFRANRLASDRDIASALARQWNVAEVDVRAHPADYQLLGTIDVAQCLAIGALPWRRCQGRVILVVSDPADAERAIKAARLEGQPIALAVAPWSDIRYELERTFKEELEANARLAGAADLTCRNWPKRKVATISGSLAAMLATLLILAPITAFWTLLTIALAINLATTFLRSAAILACAWPERVQRRDRTGITDLASRRPKPTVSVLVPLHKEDAVVASLLKNLDRLDYPKECLDLKLVVEENDRITLDAIAALSLPPGLDIIRVPDNALKTKPRAMNYALNFCRGEIVGIFDAEDRPDPDQINAVVRHLHQAPPDVAAVQARLDFYNPSHNWLSRCFTIEYSIWFNVLLKGYRRLDLPIPLGGTSVYFRRHYLERLCGWDAHNVTEDADLGIRIFRYGLRTEYLPSVTWEEANSEFIPWIRQRSRWLKGYMMTWAVHTAKPLAFFRELGLLRGLAVQVTLIGGIVAYLSIPVFWLLAAGMAGFDLPGTFGGSDLLWTGVIISMFAGQATMWSAALFAMSEPKKRWLIPWLPTLFIYWPIGALAGLKAAVEMVTAPYYWDKTSHGAYADHSIVSQHSPNCPIEQA